MPARSPPTTFLAVLQDGDELPCWTTPKLSTLFVQPDTTFKGWQWSQRENRRKGGQLADLTAEDIEALKDLELR